jgi:DNA polymerase (family 10)
MIANADIAHVLHDYAALLEIQGESTFRVRAYQNAARTVENLSEPIARLVHEQRELTALPGVGERMAEHIQEIVETGTLATLQHAQQTLPRSLTALLEVETLGPKKAKQLYEQLGVTSVPELQAALDSGAWARESDVGRGDPARLGSFCLWSPNRRRWMFASTFV